MISSGNTPATFIDNLLGDTEMGICPGTLVYSPRNVWHGFSTTGTEPLLVLETTGPAGGENAFRELSAMAATALELASQGWGYTE